MGDNSWLHSSPAFRALGDWFDTIGEQWTPSDAARLTAAHRETLTRLLRLGYVEQRWKYRLTAPGGTAEFYLQISGDDLGRRQSDYGGQTAGSSFIKSHIAPAYPFLHDVAYHESIVGHEVRLTGDGAELSALVASAEVEDAPEEFRQEFGDLANLVLLKSEAFIDAMKGTPLPTGITHLASGVTVHVSGPVAGDAEPSTAGPAKPTAEARPRKPNQGAALVLAALNKHHGYNGAGGCTVYEPGGVRQLAKLTGGGDRKPVAPGTVTNYLNKHFGNGRDEPHDAYCAACRSGQLQFTLAKLNGDLSDPQVYQAFADHFQSRGED